MKKDNMNQNFGPPIRKTFQGNGKTIVSSILNIENTSEWKIVDMVDNLALINTTDEADNLRMGHIDGVIVDMKSRLVIPSFGYSFSSTSDKLDLSLGKSVSNLSFTDDNGVGYDMKLKDILLYEKEDEIIVRLFKIRKQVYAATKSHILGNLRYFGEGVALKDLVDNFRPEDYYLKEIDTSNTVIYVKIRSNHLATVGCSKYSNQAKIIAFGLISQVKGKHEEGPVSFSHWKQYHSERKVTTVSNLGSVEWGASEEFINMYEKNLEPQQRNLSELEKFLRFGKLGNKGMYEVDSRLGLGESLLIMGTTENNMRATITITSVSRSWRLAVRGVTENLGSSDVKSCTVEEAFFNLVTSSHIKADGDRVLFKIKYPMFEPWGVKLIEENYKRVETGRQVEYKISKDNITNDGRVRLNIIWISLILSCSPYTREKAFSTFPKFDKAKEKIISEFYKLYMSDWKCSPLSSIGPTSKALNKIDSILEKRYEEGSNYKDGKQIPYEDFVKSTIKRVVNVERGDILYSMSKLL